MKVAIIFCLIASVVADNRTFPENFSFGVSSAAYQIEGGWDSDGKGKNIWDHLLHDVNPDFAYKGQNGDVAADSYHKYKEDIEILKEMKVQHYRFSIAWSRVMSNGRTSGINEAGIQYYNNLINGLVENGIMPMVTLYHWDLPNDLSEQGGFLNADIQGWFEDYARLCFERFGDRVKDWITFNEPISTCRGGYEDGTMAPLIIHMGTGAWQCGHNIILSHVKAYRLYEKEFKGKQKGRVSITIDSSWYEPASDTNEAREAAERNMIFNYEWWMSPLMEGDYPDLIKDVVARNSQDEGLNNSRLPAFTEDEKTKLKGAIDFVALNQYTSYLCVPADPSDHFPSWFRDVCVYCYQPMDWPPGSGWLRNTPWGLRNMLNYIKDRYGNPEVIITENGYSDDGVLEDLDRIEYHRSYLDALLAAILDDGCNVTGYTAWSFLDDFEWSAGYLAKFGLVKVNFDSDERNRIRKLSSYIYQNIIETRNVNWDYNPPYPPNKQ